jgi:hypothetical protein
MKATDEEIDAVIAALVERRRKARNAAPVTFRDLREALKARDLGGSTNRLLARMAAADIGTKRGRQPSQAERVQRAEEALDRERDAAVLRSASRNAHHVYAAPATAPFLQALALLLLREEGPPDDPGRIGRALELAAQAERNPALLDVWRVEVRALEDDAEKAARRAPPEAAGEHTIRTDPRQIDLEDGLRSEVRNN